MIEELFKKIISFDPTTIMLLLLLTGLFVSKSVKWIKANWKGKIKKVSAAGVNVEFETDENLPKQGNKSDGESPHRSCPHSKDVIATLHIGRKNTKLVDKIELKYIPRDMMNLAEDELDKIIAKMHSVFLTLLKEKKGLKKDLILDSSFNLYCLSLDKAKREVLKEVLRIIYENSFLEKKQLGKWNEYKKTKTSNLIDIMTTSLNRNYICDSPSREEVYDRNIKELLNPAGEYNAADEIDKALDNLFDIALRHHNKIKELEGEFDQRVNKLFGE